MRPITTPEEFCWPYAIHCIEERVQSGQITTMDYGFAMRCIDMDTMPTAEFIRHVCPRPFEVLGDTCTLAAMQHYWRTLHQGPVEQSPVYLAKLALYERPLYPKVDEGLWWHALYYNTKEREDVARLLVKNNMKYVLHPGMSVYIHGSSIAEPAI